MTKISQGLIVVSLAAMIAILHISRLLYQPKDKGFKMHTAIATAELTLLMVMLTVIAATYYI